MWLSIEDERVVQQRRLRNDFCIIVARCRCFQKRIKSIKAFERHREICRERVQIARAPNCIRERQKSPFRKKAITKRRQIERGIRRVHVHILVGAMRNTIRFALGPLGFAA